MCFIVKEEVESVIGPRLRATDGKLCTVTSPISLSLQLKINFRNNRLLFFSILLYNFLCH